MEETDRRRSECQKRGGFDIVYSPVSFTDTTYKLMARNVAAANLTTALLTYLRDEIALTVDPLEMYGQAYRQSMPCGCGIYATFRVQKLPWLAARRMGEREPTFAHIERDPCEVHGGPGWNPDWSWNGDFRAWPHNPKRADEWKA